MTKHITEEKYENLKWEEKREYDKEWVCVCNECKKKWHYLDSVERKMRSQETSNALIGLGFCCNPCVTTATSNANTQIAHQKAQLRSCPKCRSSNVKRKAKYFKETE